MSMEVSIYDAKNKLSELVKRAEQGEEVILSRHGRPVVKLIALPPRKRVLGTARGLFREIDPDWWKPMTDEETEAFYRGDD
ncbi:MAG: type II toxin-antitoxin system Phd/YefM family antitoxin [Acidobacteriaceae bacterium]|nr:type II toxin-antitoxin system Phd/YefM family antitoxin [Acidobacteriaceae bacterium]